MNDFSTLLSSGAGRSRFFLNRPDALNAVDPTMIAEATAYFGGLSDRLDVRVILMRANGRAFCAGAELGSDAFAAPGAGRPQRQMLMQKSYSGLIRLMRAVRSRSSASCMAPPAAPACRSRWPATCATPRQTPGSTPLIFASAWAAAIWARATCCRA